MGVSSMIIDNVKEFQPMMSHSVYALYIYIWHYVCACMFLIVSETADQSGPGQ